MIFSLGLIVILGFTIGFLLEKIKIPKIIGYLVLGLLLGPSLFNFIDKELLDISSYLRQLALIIILTRSGLSLNVSSLKKIGRPALLLCFVPAIFEILGVFIFGPLILNIKPFEALLLGSVLGAVSPAIIVPRMIKLIDEGYEGEKMIPKMVLAGASCDDIIVIVLFYSFLGLVKSNQIDLLSFAMIPLSIILGIIMGLALAIILNLILKKINSYSVVVFIGLSLLMVGIENVLSDYIQISSLIGIMSMGIFIATKKPDEANEMKKGFNSLWSFFEILLFVLVGAIVDLNMVSDELLNIILLLVISLSFRSIGVVICLIKTKLNFKEKIFVIISYLPKATVQASIGAIALENNLAVGNIVLTAAFLSIIITAPIGAVLIDFFQYRLLEKNDLSNCDN